MTCFHIEQIKEEIKGFYEKFGNENSFLYKKLNSVVNEKDIETELIEKEKGGWFSSSKYEANAIYETYDFSYVSKEVLLDLLGKIEKLVNECNCRESANSKSNEFEKKLEKISDELKNASLESKVYETKAGSLEVIRKEAKDESTLLQQQLLRKNSELAERETQIISLREQLIEYLERELDELEVDEEQIRKLRRLYKQLFQAKEVKTKEEIEDKIEGIRKELKEKNGVKNSRDACEKCKQLTKLEAQLEQQQQFYARQETSPHRF